MKYEKRLKINGVFILFDKLKVNVDNTKIYRNGEMIGHFANDKYRVEYDFNYDTFVYFKLVEVANES